MYLDILEDLCKDEKVIVRAKHVTIRHLESKIGVLSTNHGDGSHVASIWKEKDNEMEILMKKLNIPTMQLLQTLELKKEEE